MTKLLKKLYIFMGIIFTAIGLIGIAIPVLPTTPFIIIALALFAKGSQKFHDKFINSPLFIKHMRPILQNKEMPSRDKKLTLLLVTGVLIFGMILVKNWHVRGFLLVVLAFHYYYFLFKIRSK